MAIKQRKHETFMSWKLYWQKQINDFFGVLKVFGNVLESNGYDIVDAYSFVI